MAHMRSEGSIPANNSVWKDCWNLKVPNMVDECYLVLVRTPLFTFVRPSILLIFTILTCFVCFVLIRSLHHELTKEAKWT
jgi:hypothetical protein